MRCTFDKSVVAIQPILFDLWHFEKLHFQLSSRMSFIVCGNDGVCLKGTDFNRGLLRHLYGKQMTERFKLTRKVQKYFKYDTLR